MLFFQEGGGTGMGSLWSLGGGQFGFLGVPSSLYNFFISQLCAIRRQNCILLLILGVKIPLKFLKMLSFRPPGERLFRGSGPTLPFDVGQAFSAESKSQKFV